MNYYEAGVVNFLRTIAIIIGFIYIFRFLARIFFPIILKTYINKKQKQGYYNYGAKANKKPPKKEPTGSNQTNNKHISDDLGEYIDYEEVEE